jgi:hypothetical protein
MLAAILPDSQVQNLVSHLRGARGGELPLGGPEPLAEGVGLPSEGWAAARG